MRRGLVVAVGLALAAGACTSSAGSRPDGAAGQGGAGHAGSSGAAGNAGAGGAAGTAGSAGAAGTAGPVDAGSSGTTCHTNAECTPPEVCYYQLAAALDCSGPPGRCTRLTSPCTSGNRCACLDVPSGACTGIPGSFGCLGGDAGSSCWVCIVPA